MDYDDGLTDKQWEKMIVKGDAVGSKRKRKGRADDDFVDGQSSSSEEEEVGTRCCCCHWRCRCRLS